MESPSKVEIIKQAIKQVMEDVGTKPSSDDLLSKLMSQLESEPEAETEGLVSISDDEATKLKEEEEIKRIAKELKKVKRQNLITHCLLSVMILLTITWQISEISIILRLKDGVSHPFRSIGSIFKGLLKPPRINGTNGETESNDLIESSPIHDLKIPELPHVDLPKIDFNYEDED